MISLRPYQERGVQEIRAKMMEGFRAVLYQLPTGGGKCLGWNTPVLMFNGEIKAVQDIVIGDLLMGPDSNPRRVVSLAHGRENLYRITPIKGDEYIINESHILSLKTTGISKNNKYTSMAVKGNIVNISLNEYINKSKTWKHTHKGWRAAVDFPFTNLHSDVPAYILGVWLGDGSTNFPHITSCDHEIVSQIMAHAANIGCEVHVSDAHRAPLYRYTSREEQVRGRGHKNNNFWNALNQLNILGNKHIPHAYKTSSRNNRLELLAGLIDSDGSYTGKGYDLVFKVKAIADDCVFVARSLGFSAQAKPCKKTCNNNGVTGDYYRICISGDVDLIPCRVKRKIANPRKQKKSVLVTGITAKCIGEGDYYGFELAGPDRLFLLGDFTVTHNTYTFSYIAERAAFKGKQVFILVHRKELLKQASRSLDNLKVSHGLISPHFTPRTKEIVQVASVDTLLARIKNGTLPHRPDLLIGDEAHHFVAGNKWGKVYDALGAPVMLGVTATPVRSDGKGLGTHAGGLFDTMVLGPTMPELIDMGCLVKPDIYGPQHNVDLEGVTLNAAGEYNSVQLAQRMEGQKQIVGDAVERYQQVCPGAKAIVFAASVKHADIIVERFNAAGFRFKLLVGAPAMSDTERDAVNRDLASGVIDGAVTVDLVSEGYDLPDLECGILLRPTQSEGLFLQQVGRIMRPSPGKSMAYILDHVGNIGLMRDDVFVRKHGLPWEFRDWTLDGRKKGRRNKDAEAEITMKRCPVCYRIHPITQIFCGNIAAKPIEPGAVKKCPTCWKMKPAETSVCDCDHVFNISPFEDGCGYEWVPIGRMVKEVEGIIQKMDTDAIEEQSTQARLSREARGQAKTKEEVAEWAKTQPNIKSPTKYAENVIKARDEKADRIKRIKQALSSSKQPIWSPAGWNAFVAASELGERAMRVAMNSVMRTDAAGTMLLYVRPAMEKDAIKYVTDQIIKRLQDVLVRCKVEVILKDCLGQTPTEYQAANSSISAQPSLLQAADQAINF